VVDREEEAEDGVQSAGIGVGEGGSRVCASPALSHLVREQVEP